MIGNSYGSKIKVDPSCGDLFGDLFGSILEMQLFA